jgi:polysaccharide biosynthesis protein PslH
MKPHPRILVVCPDIPYPIIAGGHMRMASIIPALARFAKINVLFFNRSETVPEETIDWFKNLEASYFSYRRKKSRAARARALCNKISMLVRRDNLVWHEDEQWIIDKQVRIFDPDCIWLETPYLLRYFLNIKKRLPVIVDYWGLLSEGCYRDFLYAPLRKKAAKWLYWFIATSAEKRYAKCFPWAISVSTPISDYLQSIAPQSRIFTVPNGIVKVNAETAQRYAATAEEYDLILTGDFSFRPNIDTARYFTRAILPIIRKKMPTVTLRISGRNPAEEVAALIQEPLITMSGYVDDLLLEIARARVYILPLRMGSGIRSKLFDVFPLGKPIVTSSTGAEGLELMDEENCFIANTPAHFARRCIELLENASLRRCMGHKAKKLATETYAQKTIDDEIARILALIMKG